MKSFLVILSLLSTSSLFAEGPGKALFAAAGCSSCHKVGPIGGNSGPDLTFVGFRRSPQWLDRWLSSPRAWKKDTLMPEPNLSAAARAKIVEYLASQKGQAYAGRRPWQGAPLRGRAIFQKAGCLACHGSRGEGGHPNNNVEGGVIPPLPALVATYTPVELRDKIRRGSKPEKKDASGPEPLVAMPAWGGALDEEEIADVADYLRTLSAGLKNSDW